MANIKATIVMIKPSEKLQKEIAVITTAEHGTGSLIIESMTAEARQRLMGIIEVNGVQYRNPAREQIDVTFLGTENGYPRFQVVAPAASK
jgi:hypothetical protein